MIATNAWVERATEILTETDEEGISYSTAWIERAYEILRDGGV